MQILDNKKHEHILNKYSEIKLNKTKELLEIKLKNILKIKCDVEVNHKNKYIATKTKFYNN